MSQSRTYDRILSEHECERCRRWYQIEVERRNAYIHRVKERITALPFEGRAAMHKTHRVTKWRESVKRELCDQCKLYDMCVEANLLMLLLKLGVIR